MQINQSLIFGHYRFDPQTKQLWRAKQEVRLTWKALVVLGHLLDRAGQIVTKDELFQTVWPDTVVSDAALTSCIQELREALHDNARKPRYIETLYRRGFRFLGEVASSQHSVVSSPPSSPQSSVLSLQHSILVGRESDLAFLHERLAKALNGERQLVFVTGEPGIGKTTLIENFVFGVRSREQFGVMKSPKSRVQSPKLQTPNSEPPSTPRWWVAVGRCIEHYGVGEAYLPILEALGRLCREEAGNELRAQLQQHAPSWLVQMPSLLSTAELEELQRRTAGVTRERMLRELAEALEVITAERPLVLVLEDLHWSDVSTLDLLSMLARRQERAQLLIIGTYRPVEVLTRELPLKGIKQELQLHGQCEELALDFLTEAAVGEYLEYRFAVGAPGRSPLQRLAHVVHQRTDGNPLFMVNVTNELVAREIITNSDGHWEVQSACADDTIGVPENLRQLIELQLGRVSPDERKILEAASVTGAEFSAAAVAAGVEHSPEAVETCCDNLVRREQFFCSQGTNEWPDGTVTARYGFVHALYQEVVYEQLSATRRSRLHRQIGEREEQAYGERAREIAAELAVHFERGRDYRKAVQYLQHAGENAARRSAHHEAIGLLTKGLELLKTLPDTLERTQQELDLQITLGPVLMVLKGNADPEVERVYTRAQALCQRVGETPRLFTVLAGLRNFYNGRGKHQTARELGEQLLGLAQRVQDPALLLEAHLDLGGSLFSLGELIAARMHLQQSIALYDPRQHHSNAFICGGSDPGVNGLCNEAFTLWSLGYPDQALKRSHAGLTLARELTQPSSLCVALGIAALLHQLRGEIQATQRQTEEMIALSREQGFLQWPPLGTVMQGWMLAEQGQVEEGIAKLRQGVAALRAMGAEVGLPYYLALLAAAYAKAGRVEEGLAVQAEAMDLVHRNGQRLNEPGLYVLKGWLLLARSGDNQAEAEGCFRHAIDIARRQSAKSSELRAVMSLSFLLQRQGKKEVARLLLAEIYGWFTEGFDTKDLQEAKALLEELSH
ncbi:MAG: AAA family ATPase [Deltaproteobacteria bacterium]|nr:AAA family ATPase [Deltaproteobacteria bacterium]